jgi:hypothetical protein
VNGLAGATGANGPTGAAGPTLGVLDCAEYSRTLSIAETIPIAGLFQFNNTAVAPLTARIVPVVNPLLPLTDYNYEFRLLSGTYRISWSVPIQNTSSMALYVDTSEYYYTRTDWVVATPLGAGSYSAHTNTAIVRLSATSTISIRNTGASPILINWSAAGNLNANLCIECIRAT